MKVALVSETFYPHVGGVTEHVHHLARFLAGAGHDVRVVTNHKDERPRRPDREAAGAYAIVRVGRGLGVVSNGGFARVTVGLGLQSKMDDALAGADVVHVHSPLFPTLPYLALKSARRARIPTVGTLHTSFTSGLLRAFAPGVRAYARAIDRWIAVSPSAARCVSEYVDAPMAVIPNGVDCDAWLAAPADKCAARTIAFLGRLDPRNDVDVVLGAFLRFAERRPDIGLVLVGGGEELPRHRARVPQALRERVVFTGTVTDVSARAAHVAAAEMLVFTARRASHPLALLEGLAAGRPAVAYDIEGVRELITDGREGYLVPPGDEAALADAIERLFDARDRVAMGEHARACALAFDWRHIGPRVEAIYRDAIEGATRDARLAG